MRYGEPESDIEYANRLLRMLQAIRVKMSKCRRDEGVLYAHLRGKLAETRAEWDTVCRRVRAKSHSAGGLSPLPPEPEPPPELEPPYFFYTDGTPVEEPDWESIKRRRRKRR